jgi:hypothetical protein
MAEQDKIPCLFTEHDHRLNTFPHKLKIPRAAHPGSLCDTQLAALRSPPKNSSCTHTRRRRAKRGDASRRSMSAHVRSLRLLHDQMLNITASTCAEEIWERYESHTSSDGDV